MPPAIFVLPLTSKEQVVQMVNYVVSKVKQLSVEVRHIPPTPRCISSKNSRDGIMERVDVYLATSAGDYANVLPVREEIKEGFVEKVDSSTWSRALLCCLDTPWVKNLH